MSQRVTIVVEPTGVPTDPRLQQDFEAGLFERVGAVMGLSVITVGVGDSPSLVLQLQREVEHLKQPIPMLLYCPMCHARHIDEGEFAQKVHHTHACQAPRCGHVWRPAIVATVGVWALPGFSNVPAGPLDTTTANRLPSTEVLMEAWRRAGLELGTRQGTPSLDADPHWRVERKAAGMKAWSPLYGDSTEQTARERYHRHTQSGHRRGTQIRLVCPDGTVATQYKRQ